MFLRRRSSTATSPEECCAHADGQARDGSQLRAGVVWLCLLAGLSLSTAARAEPAAERPGSGLSGNAPADAPADAPAPASADANAHEAEPGTPTLPVLALNWGLSPSGSGLAADSMSLGKPWHLDSQPLGSRGLSRLGDAGVYAYVNLAPSLPSRLRLMLGKPEGGLSLELRPGSSSMLGQLSMGSVMRWQTDGGKGQLALRWRGGRLGLHYGLRFNL